MLLHIDTALKKRDITPEDEDTLTYQRASAVYALSGIAQAHTGVFQLPLRKYFEAAAAMTEYYYPVWLYLRNVQPHLCNQPEDSFCLADLLNVCQPYILFSDRSSVLLFPHWLRC